MVNDEKVSIVYAGNGTTRVFDYPYTFTEPDEITGYLSDGTTVTKITSNFEFNTTTKQYTYPTTGASIATGYNLLLTRHTEKSNKVDLPHESPFDDIERQFDKIVRILQEIDSNEGTGVGVTVIGNGFNGMIPKGRPYAYIRFNKDASAFEVVDDPFIEAESTLETIRVLRSDMQTLQSDMETARDAVEAAKESVNNTVGSFKSEANTLLANHKNELTSLSASLANNVTECGNEALAQLQAYYSEKAQRIEAAAGYATQAKESADAAAASAAQAAADKATVQAVRDDVLINKQSVEATVQNFETLADEVQANKNTMENLAAIVANDKYDVGQMKDAANTSVINAANSATNAANSAAEAKTYKDQAEAIVGGDLLTKLDASQTYATITDMNTKANQTSLDDLKATVNANTQAISTKQPSGSYLTTTDASNTYLTQADASSTYLTQENASSTYLSKKTASQTYATSANLNSALTRLSTAESNITSLTNNKADKGNYATVEYVDGRVANLVNSAPETLDTLNELANALGNDPNFATTVSAQIGQKANSADVYPKSYIDNLVNTLYPVGIIVEFFNSVDPNTVWKGTTWERMEAGRVLISAGQYSESDYSHNYTLGETGGEATHQLTVDEMPSHNHHGWTGNNGQHSHTYYSITQGQDQNAGDGGSNYWNTNTTSSAGNHNHEFTTDNTGSNWSHNNIQPYITVNHWKRVG